MLVRVLVGLPEPASRGRLVRILESIEKVLAVAAAPAEFWVRLNQGDVDLVLLGEGELGRRPAEMVGTVRELPEKPEVIALVRREDARERGEYLAAGCLAVLNLELPDDALRAALRTLVERCRSSALRQLGDDRWRQAASLQDFVSESPAMQRFMTLAHRVVPSDSSLLLLGETGVGKERLARAIHHEGPRTAGPFLAVNCAALPETLLESELFGHEKGAFTGATRARRGYFELAHGGTIFLDEIGELPLHLQVKLLRVLEARTIQRLGSEVALPVDVRVMAATNRDLEQEVRQKRFRSDLYYRLAVVTLDLPPLRERREDVPALLDSYLVHFSLHLGRPATGFAPRAREALVRHDWPGNVRELINVVERSVLLATGPVIEISDLPAAVTGAIDDPLAADLRPRPVANVAPAASWGDRPLFEAREAVLQGFHREYLSELLEATGGRVGETARRAGINVRTLYQLMRDCGLRKEDFRRSGKRGCEAS